MTIKAMLWTYEKRVDGTADVKIYTYPPKKYYSTGIKIKPVDWDKKKGEVKRNHPSSVILNAKIARLKTQFTNEMHGPRREDMYLLAFLKLFLEEVEKGMHPIKLGTARKYKSTLTRLKQYCADKQIENISFSNCTLNWHSEFCRWLFDFGNCKAPGVTKHTKILKKILRLAKKRKLHSNLDFMDFPTDNRTSSKMYLDKREIELLRDVNLNDFPHLRKERDRFLISYFLLMRFGDSIKVSKDNAYQEDGQWFYRYISEKTERSVVIPIKPLVLEILDRNHWNFTSTTNQQSNRAIKQVAAMAGFTDVVVENDKQGVKSQFITTHTARRSAATNMALAGVQIDTIAKLGGWDKISTLRIYLRASGTDIARQASTLNFFK